MSRQKQLEKRGWTITYLLGYRDGIQCVTGIMAEKKGHYQIIAESITELFNKIIGK